MNVYKQQQRVLNCCQLQKKLIIRINLLPTFNQMNVMGYLSSNTWKHMCLPSCGNIIVDTHDLREDGEKHSKWLCKLCLGLNVIYRFITNIIVFKFSIYLSFFLPIFLSICRSIYLSFYQFVFIFACVFIYLYTYIYKTFLYMSEHIFRDR